MFSINSCSKNPNLVEHGDYYWTGDSTQKANHIKPQELTQSSSHEYPTQEPRILVKENYGSWRVKCTRDVITDEKKCNLSGILSNSNSHSFISLDIDETAPHKFTLKMGPLWSYQMYNDFLVRVDQNEVIFVISDGRIERDIYKKITSRVNILSQMSHGNTLRIREQSNTSINYDYEIPLKGFNEAITLYHEKMNEYNLVP